MTNTKNKPPNEVILDLIQDNEMDYIDYMGKIITKQIRPRISGDGLPSIHALLNRTNAEQRTIPHAKKLLDRVKVYILYYTDDLSKLWSAYQSIKEIIVGNNKLTSTSQFSSTNVKWSLLKETKFDYVYIDEEVILGYFKMTVEVVYDDTYF